MLNKKYVITLTFLLSSLFAVVDFFLFRLWPKFAFYIHNSLALFVGLGLIYFSYKLTRVKCANMYIAYLSIIAGFAMIVIHIVKLFIGNCI
jgi:hypothetical protein